MRRRGAGRRSRSTSTVVAFLLTVGMGCGGGKEATPDSGRDTATETEPGTGPDTDTSFPDPVEWEWQDNPPGEDCGPGCKQLTFSAEVKAGAWDVWGDYLVYRPDGPGERDYVILVDVPTSRRMKIPSVFEAEGVFYSTVMSPTIHEDRVYYSMMIWGYSHPTRQLVEVDFLNETQTVLYSETEFDNTYFNGLKYLDAYASYVVSQAGCGTEAAHGYSLCLFETSAAPAVVQTLIDDDYGNYNSIWDGVLVFTDSRPGHFDVTGYNITAQQFLPITDDADYTQFSPRIQGRKVAYSDLRFGTNQDAFMGNLNHAAVFVHDLDTQAKAQITSGEWIAVDPDIWSEIVVWLDFRACDDPNDVHDFSEVQVWGYNLNTNQQFKVTRLPEDACPERPKATPRIWGYRVYVDMISLTPEIYDSIYVFDLPEGAR